MVLIKEPGLSQERMESVGMQAQYKRIRVKM